MQNKINNSIKILLFISIIFLLTSCGSKEDIDKEIFTVINKKEYKQNTLCKEQVKTNKQYMQCLESKTQENPSIENLNYLAGVYAVKKDYKKAISLYEKSASKGDKKAQYYLGGIYFEELKDDKKALGYFLKIKDYSESICKIGLIYHKESSQKAKKFYEKELKDKNSIAGVCLGRYYLKLKMYNFSEKAYKKAEKLGNIQALYELGSLNSAYLKDKKAAMNYYRKAALKGDVKSVHNIAVLNDKNFKFDEAKKWYELSCKAGDKNSCLGLAHVYRKEKNYTKAIAIFTSLGDRGDARGYNDAGLIYVREFKDFDKAVDSYKKGLKLGNGSGASGIAIAYELLKKDYDKAIEWYTKSYAMGSLGGTYTFANFYKNTLKDNINALKWFKRYEKINHFEGSFILGNFYRKDLKDYKKAILWYKKSIALLNYRAMTNLANLYYFDLKDKEKAIEWYKKAYKNGSSKAKLQLINLGVIK